MATTAYPIPGRNSYLGPLLAPYFFNTTRCLDPTVPGLLDVSIAGRGFAVATNFEAFRRESFRSQSLTPVADKQDWSNIPGSGSVNTESLWRREMQDWSGGSGQLFLDRRASSPNRFLKSKGVYPWQQDYVSLLNDTTCVYPSSGVTQVLVVGNNLAASSTAGQVVYVVDGGTVKYSSGTLSSWTTVGGLPGTVSGTNAALACDGLNVYIACRTGGIYIAEAATATAYSWVTGSVNNIWYVGGQLMASGPNSGNASSGNALYNITLSTPSWPTTPSPTAIIAAGPAGGTALLYTALNGSFVWDCAAAGASWVYVGGRTSLPVASGFSIVYKTQMNATGTAMTVPVVACTLPGGELVYSLYAYSNFTLMGTSLGARFCQTLGVNDPGGSAGDLKIGPIVPDQIQQVGYPVRCFTGQGRFVWFAWSDYDNISTGLGRMDLSTFIDVQAPAYTSDLMATGSGEVLSMDWYGGAPDIAGVTTGGAPLFVVAGLGVYTTTSTFVPQGIIDTGYITLGLPDQKVGLKFDFNATGTGGSVAAVVTVDDNSAGAFTTSAMEITNVLTEEVLPTMTGELFDLQIQINAGASNTVTPFLTHFQIKALPAVVLGTQHIVPLNVFSTVTAHGIDIAYNPYGVFAFLDGLRQSAEVIAYWDGANFVNGRCVITELDSVRYQLRPGSDGGFEQIIVVFLKSLEG